MRQLTCKSLSFLLINIFILSSTLQAQDTSKTAKPSASVNQPNKVVKPPASKTTSPRPAVTTAAPSAASGPIDNSLNGQYEALLKHSWMQQGYKVVNPTRLTMLWKSVNDSLNNNKKQLADAKRKIREQETQLATLKSGPEKTTIPERQTISVAQIEVLGIAVDVPTYNWIVWGTILALALGLAGVLFTTTKNSIDSKHYKLQYEEVSSEYQAYKAKAKEKELKLARELQTERNTIEELRAKNEEAIIKRGKK